MISARVEESFRALQALVKADVEQNVSLTDAMTKGQRATYEWSFHKKNPIIL